MGALQQLFTAHGAAYLREYGETMPGTHQKVIAAMVACRTPQAGTLWCSCAACGAAHLLPRSCGNRHCPTCQGRKALLWLERQLDRALPTHHFMLTFTVPEPLRAFLRANQRIGYEALFAASAGAIRALAREPRFNLGDQPGFFGVLHTWGRTLQYHPHIHYGFLSARFGVPFEEVRARVEMAHGFAAQPVNTDIDAPAPKPMVCSHCGGALKLLRVLHSATQRPSSASASSGASPAAPAALAAGP